MWRAQQRAVCLRAWVPREADLEGSEDWHGGATRQAWSRGLTERCYVPPPMGCLVPQNLGDPCERLGPLSGAGSQLSCGAWFRGAASSRPEAPRHHPKHASPYDLCASPGWV